MVVGVILLIWGVIGLFTSSFLGVATTGLQTWLFIIAGVVGLYTGLAGGGIKGFAKIFGVIFTLGGILGFVASGVMDALTLSSTVTANIVHLVAGLWGLWAGFGNGGGNQMARPMTPPQQQGGGQPMGGDNQ